jgi:16S rRNA (cytosine1402-N4)-methyltransferase
LAVREDGTYVDCTAGAGGHAEQIAQRLAAGRLIALDRDPAAVEATRKRLRAYGNVEVLHRNYGHLAQVLREQGVDTVDGILLDAGVASSQIDDPTRGFSFQQDGRLDMRMDTTQTDDALTFLASTDARGLTRVLRENGDVRPAGRIAKAIIDRRDSGRLETTGDLVAAVQEALPFVRGVPDEVRTVFQAIRVAVNEEYRWLERGLEQAVDALAPKGRLVVIAFHSGEDRIVKNVLRNASRQNIIRFPDGRTRSVKPPRLRVLTSKPERPDEAEVRSNPRCISARLRVAERLSDEGGTAS